MRLVVSLLAIPVLAQQGVNFYTIEKEKALGRQCALEVKKHSKPLADPGIAGYVNRIGQELVDQLKAAGSTIRSRRSKEPNGRSPSHCPADISLCQLALLSRLKVRLSCGVDCALDRPR
jgi:hypothetical protein